jgi:hypothetical protein
MPDKSEIAPIVFIIVTSLVFLGYIWGRRDGMKKAYAMILGRWLRQCPLCARDHLGYATDQCIAGEELRRQMKARWAELRKD